MRSGACVGLRKLHAEPEVLASILALAVLRCTESSPSATLQLEYFGSSGYDVARLRSNARRAYDVATETS